MSRVISYTIDDPVEDGNVAGWVRKGYDEPEWVPTKLVSEARTRKRWSEVAKAYPELGPVDPPQPATGGSFLGEIAFDGARHPCPASGQGWYYAELVIPTGCAGKVSDISYSEYVGVQTAWFVTFRKTAGDFSRGPDAIGNSGNIRLSFDPLFTSPSRISVRGGERWYMNFGLFREDGTPLPGLSPGDDRSFQITAGIPT